MTLTSATWAAARTAGSGEFVYGLVDWHDVDPRPVDELECGRGVVDLLLALRAVLTTAFHAHEAR